MYALRVSIGPYPPGLVPELALQEKGVRVDDTVNRPWGGERYEPRRYLFQQSPSRKQRRPEPRREVSAVAGAGACPGINGRDRRPANLVEDGLVHEVELSRQSVGGV